MKTVVAAAVALAAVSAGAAPIVNDNMRPKPINNAPGSETDLQTVLDSTFGAGQVDKAKDQSKAGLWGSATGVPGSTVPTLQLEQTSLAGSQKFGIWFGTDTSNIYMVDLLLGGATPALGNRTATIDYDFGTLIVSGPNCGTSINCGTFMNAAINPNSFGFYFQNNNVTAYSIDSILGETRFLAYQGTGIGGTNWVFAFEDGGDLDYNDMVVKVESIKPVSAPGTLALLGLGLLGIGALRRRNAA